MCRDTHIALCHTSLISLIDLRHLLSTSSHISAIKSCVNGCCKSTGVIVAGSTSCSASDLRSLCRQLSATSVITTPSAAGASVVSAHVVSLFVLMPPLYAAGRPRQNYCCDMHTEEQDVMSAIIDARIA